MRRRYPGFALAAALWSLSGTACRQAPDEESLTRVRIGYRPHLTLAPIFIAKAEGLYEAEGLDVELVPVEGVASSVPMLLQGGLDVLPGPVTAGLFNAISRGGRIRVVQDKGWYFPDDCFPTAIVRSKQLAARDGMPRRLGTTKETFLQMFTDRALRAHGVDPKTVELMYIPAAAEYDAIVSGRLDAANLGEPWLSRALAQGAVVWEPVNGLMGRDTYSVISYGPTLLDESPAIGEHVSRAHLKAMRVYNKGKTERNLEIVSGMLNFTPEDLRNTCWPKMREDGLIDTTSLRKFQEWSKARGELDEVLPVERYWDGRFVARATSANARTP
jgi:NitT/TauT family transport system substrate-binding protein